MFNDRLVIVQMPPTPDKGVPRASHRRDNWSVIFMGKSEPQFKISDRSKKNFTMLPNGIVRKRWPRGFKEVLLSIASRAGDGGACTAGAALLGSENGVKPATVYAAIDYWKKLGVIEVHHREGKPPEIVTCFDYTIAEYPQVCPERHTPSVHTYASGGTPPMPQEADPPMPLEAHKEEPVKNNPEEERRRTGDKYIFSGRGRRTRYGPNEGMQPIGKLLDKHRRP